MLSHRGLLTITLFGALLLLLFISFASAQTLRILAPAGALADGLETLTRQFTEETGIQVEFSKFGYQELFERTMTLVQARSSAFDILFLDDPWMPRLAPLGHLIPLDSSFGYSRDPEVFPVSYDVFTWDPPYGPIPPDIRIGEQHLYALPIVGNVILMALRQDVLEKHGLPVPRTWEEMIQVSQAVYDPENGFYGFIFRGASAGADFMPILWSMGGDVFDEDFNVILDNEVGVQAATVLAELAKYGPPGMGNYSTSELASDFLAGRAMAGFHWPGDALVALEDPARSESAGKLMYLPGLAGEEGGDPISMMGHWGLGISAYSNNAEVAYDYVTWVTDATRARDLALSGGIPYRSSLYEDTELIALFPWYPAQREALAVPPRWRSRTEHWNIVSDALNQNISQMITGRYTPEEAISRAAEAIRLRISF